MLVDINLLPKKEYKNRANLLMIFLIGTVAIAGFLFVFLQANKANALEEDLANQLASLQEARAEKEEKGAIANHSNSVLQLKKTAEWADNYFVETVPVLQHLTELLPERGFVQSFSYSDSGGISLQVQFDTNTEIAHYLALLNDSSNLESVTLSTVSTSPLMEDVVDEIEGNESDHEQNLDDNEDNAPLPNNAAKTNENDNILPRYYAQFELIISKDAFHTIVKEGN